MFKIFLLLCSLTYVQCQAPAQVTDCQTQLTEVSTCLTNVKANMTAMRTAMLTAMNDNKTLCFTNNSCTAPTFSSSQNATALNCAKQRATSIEQCISLNTGITFSFPTMNAEGEHHGFSGSNRKDGKHGKTNNVDDFLKEFGNVCNGNNDSIKAVQKCLQRLENNMENGKHNMKNGHGKYNMKNSFDFNCARNLTTDCQAQLENITATACRCSSDNTTVQNFASCMGFDAKKADAHRGFDLCHHFSGYHNQGFNKAGRGESFNRGFSNQEGSFNRGDSNQGGSFNRGFSNQEGSFNRGGSNQGGSFNRGGSNQGGSFNRGGSNQGGSFNRGINQETGGQSRGNW